MSMKKIKDHYDRNPILCILILATIVAPIIYVGGRYTLAATGHELYNEIDTDLKLFDYGDYDDDPATGPVYTFLEYESSRVFTTLMVATDVSHTEGLTGVKLYICKDADGSVGEAVVSVDMELVGANSYKSTINVDGWATDSYWAKISPTVSTHQVNVGTNPDYTDWEDYMDWWNALSETDQLSYYDLWKETGGSLPREPSQYLYETKSDVFVVIAEPRKFVVKNPNQDMTFTIGITQADGTELGSGGTTNQPMTFWCDISVGVATQVALTIYTESHSRVVHFSYIDDAEFNVGSAQENGNYYAKVTAYGADGWNSDSMSIPFTIGNPVDIAGTVTLYRADSSGWEVVLDGGQIGGDMKIEVVLDTGIPASMTAVFDGVTYEYRFPMTYDVSDGIWKTTLNTREMVNSYYTIYVEVVRSEDGAVSYLSAFSFDTKGGADAGVVFPLVPVLLIVGVLGIITVSVYLYTGGFNGKIKKKKGYNK